MLAKHDILMFENITFHHLFYYHEMFCGLLEKVYTDKEESSSGTC